MTMSAELAEARLKVSRLEAAHEAEEHAQMVAELAKVSDEYDAVVAERTRLKAEISARNVAIANAREAVAHANSALTDYIRSKQRTYDHLPGRPEAVAWAQGLRKLEAERDELVDALAKLPSAYDLIGEYNRLGQCVVELSLAKDNLCNRLEGRSNKSWARHGGISGVA